MHCGLCSMDRRDTLLLNASSYSWCIHFYLSYNKIAVFLSKKKKDKAFYIFLSACSLAHLLQTTLLVQPHKKTINWCHPFEPPLWAIHNHQCWPYQPSSLDFEREKKWVNGTRSGNISGEKESRSMGFGRCFKNWTGPTSLNENWALIQTNQKPGWTGN